MKRLLILILLGFLSATSVNAKTLTLGIDLSGSNILLTHKNFAFTASEYVKKEIHKLKNGDVVIVRTFGSRDDARNILTTEFPPISRRNKPVKIAASVSQYIQSLPSQTDLSQSSTNLVAWIEFSSGFNCSDQSQIIVLTDALESSSVADSTALESGKNWLPEPDVNLKGCQIVFYGLGAGMPHKYVKTMRNEWRSWSEKAGATFIAIIP